ncbi:HAMP domain-containing histidine kinase [Herbiconiux moechotypicola]|uniref:histidine kinase n=1 Tax=Herbiconiux moechotypicola TaxID=637393 RepID=A0ABP5QLV6_9MICO|nr:HAMP domain-containing histidine kinase [Herbiconiux moechotypicola]MCS5730703.1 HAMP domain-containing histidine kinase [Herbiconiux moechotypicola]
MLNAILTQWNAISLRTKITGVTVLMLTFGLVVSGVGTMVVLRTYLLQQVDSQLEAASRDPSPFLGPDATTEQFSIQDITSAPTEYFVGLLDAQGNLIVSNWSDRDEGTVPDAKVSLETSAELGGNVFSVRSVDQRTEWHAVTSTVILFGGDDSSGSVIIAKSLAETERTTATYLSIFLAFGVGVVILGAMLTRLLVTSTFGPLREVEATAAAIADGGDFSRRLTDVEPNTEVGRLNRSLNTMLSRIDTAFADRARTIDQMRRFVGDASHELRTPLVSVRGYAELYRMGALQTPEDVAQAMDRIEKEAIRMGTLVEDLLELARLDETRPLQLALVDLVPLTMDAAMDARAASPGRVVSVITPHGPSSVTFGPALDAVGETAGDGSSGDDAGTPSTATRPIPFAGALARLRRRGRGTATSPLPIVDPSASAAGVDGGAGDGEPVEVVVVPEEVRPIVLAEENKIRQVLTNLIGNALRFTDDDSPIELSVRADETRGVAVVDIIDHGEGIPPQIREKIFQRFWRADSSRTRETGGSGLGLAIVSSILHAHHGTVEALETRGGGATFRVTLPLATP